jgi:hypothetical protein
MKDLAHFGKRNFGSTQLHGELGRPSRHESDLSMAKSQRFNDSGKTARDVNLYGGFSAQAVPDEVLERFGFLEHFVAGERGLDSYDEFLLRRRRWNQREDQK